MRIERLNFPGLPIIQAILLGGFLLWAMYKVFVEPPHVEQIGDPLEVRGNAIVEIRTPHVLGFEHITIFEDGQAVRIPIPYNNAVDPSRWFTLSQQEQIDIAAFRTEWCQNRLPTLNNSVDDTAFDLAVLCYDHTRKQAQVTEATLPPVLQNILMKIPQLRG